ncbi:MAG: hypothetical protein V4488_07975 [Pseudomonadota bacterium]
MTPEREREYDELLAYLSFFATAVWKISPTSSMHPAQTSVKIAGEFGKSKALVGLRQAVNDTVEDISDWSAEARSIVDDALIAAGITPTTEIARRYASAYKRIVKRGQIKNESEYYLVNGVAVDYCSQISDEERATLRGLLDTFENKHLQRS